MQEIISHLPISPWSDPELGYYSQHLYADVASAIEQKPYVFTSNIVGGKSAHKGEIEEQLRYLDKIGIPYSDTWIDAEEVDSRYVEGLLNIGLREGWIEKQRREVFLCPCGRTEFINTPENLHPAQERTTYTVDEEAVTCKLCNENASLEEKEVLILKIPQITLPYVNIYPDYAKSEIEQHLRFFRGKDYLLSRNSIRPISANVEGNSYYIDTDISWIPFIFKLQEHQYKIGTLLTGNRTLKQTALALLVNSMLGAKLPTSIISTPHIDIDFGDKPRLRAKTFLENNGANVTRIFIGQAFGTDRKAIVLKSAGAYWIAKSLEHYTNKVLTPKSNSDIKLFMNTGNKMILDNILKKLRSNASTELTDYEQRYLWALMTK